MKNYHAHFLAVTGPTFQTDFNIMRCYCKRICFYACNLFFTFSLSLLIIWIYRRGKFNLNSMIKSRNFSDYYSYRKIAIAAQFVQHDDLNLLTMNNQDNGDREFFVVEKILDWEKFRIYVQERRSVQKFGLNMSTLLSNVKKKNPSFFLRPKICSRTKRINSKNSSSWRIFYDNVGQCDLYGSEPYYSEIVGNLLNDMLNTEIKSVKNLPGGTQVKLETTFVNGYKAVMKPMRFHRQYETHPDQFYFTDFERHNAEIASFHLDRLLGYRRALPTVGRLVNLSDIRPKSEMNLSRLFFYSPAKNLCFVGTCTYYCDTTHAICGNPDTIESSFQVFIPQRLLHPNKRLESPFTRTYSKHNQKALWQQQTSYCETRVKNSSNAQYLLDIIDVAILDFLTGNQDRHHFEFVRGSKNHNFFMHIDNGRSFGRSDADDLDILAPLWQCCLIKSTTFETIMSFYDDPIKLSRNLNESMSDDPLMPLLADKHFDALERRLEIIVQQIDKCIFEKYAGDFERVVKNVV